MRPALGIAASVMALVALSAAPARAVEPDLPVVGGKRALATVNGDAVTLESFLLELASIHEGEEAKEGKRPRQAPWALLDRLITARLVVQEARNIGLDASPEIKREMEAFRLETLERLLLERQVREIRKADPAAVERRTGSGWYPCRHGRVQGSARRAPVREGPEHRQPAQERGRAAPAPARRRLA